MELKAQLCKLRTKLELHPEPGTFITSSEASARWSNLDLDPVKRQNRKYEWYHIAGFWISDGFAAINMENPSSAFSLGLNPGLSVLACFVANLFVVLPCMTSGYMGTKYGANYSVLIRASFGMWGSYLAITIRGVVCVIYYGLLCSLGGQCCYLCISAIFPSFAKWHINSLPESANISAPELVSFVIFWLGSLPFLLIPMAKLRYIFSIKTVLVPLFYVGLLTWAITASGGWRKDLWHSKNHVTNGFSATYVFFYAVNATISGNATYCLNMPDFTRNSKNARTTMYAQAVTIPILMTLTELLGTAIAVASVAVYGGDVVWNPVEVLMNWQDRPAKFFVGAFLAFAMVVTNIIGNSVAFGNDLTAIFPKYINIKRGQLICAIIAFAITPWNM